MRQVLIVGLSLLIPSISIGARRLHDTGRSGWWQLIYFVPLIGLIVMIVFLVQDSHDDNDYGVNPKSAVSALDLSCLNGKITAGHRFAIVAKHYFPLRKTLMLNFPIAPNYQGLLLAHGCPIASTHLGYFSCLFGR